MSPQLSSEAGPIVWSNCSRRDITRFLDRNWGTCLEDRPSDHDFRYPELPPGAMYNVDHQCRLQYGPEAVHCAGMDEVRFFFLIFSFIFFFASPGTDPVLIRWSRCARRCGANCPTTAASPDWNRPRLERRAANTKYVNTCPSWWLELDENNNNKNRAESVRRTPRGAPSDLSSPPKRVQRFLLNYLKKKRLQHSRMNCLSWTQADDRNEPRHRSAGASVLIGRSGRAEQLKKSTIITIRGRRLAFEVEARNSCRPFSIRDPLAGVGWRPTDMQPAKKKKKDRPRAFIK